MIACDCDMCRTAMTPPGVASVPMLILRDELGFEREEWDFGGKYFAHDRLLPDGGYWRTLFRDDGERDVSGKRVLVAEGPVYPPAAPPPAPAPTLALTELARAMFWTDPEVRAFADVVTDRGRSPHGDAMEKIWNRDERGWRTRAVARAAFMRNISTAVRMVSR